MLAFFSETYEENREQFRSLADSIRKRYDEVETASHRVKSSTDSDLSIDTVYLPARDMLEQLLIMSSGTHGIEGWEHHGERLFLARFTSAQPGYGVVISRIGYQVKSPQSFNCKDQSSADRVHRPVHCLVTC